MTKRFVGIGSLSLLLMLVGVPSFAATVVYAIDTVTVAPSYATLDVYAIDSGHSEVGFRIRHLMSKVSGEFDAFSGAILIDPKDYSKGSVAFSIDASSIDTNNADRDIHLRGPDFFDVERFPKITFTSKKVVVISAARLLVSGDLTMRGVTRSVNLSVAIGGFAIDPWGNEKAGFEATGTLNRKDFGMVWNKHLDKGGTILGDDVELSINLEVVKQRN